MGESLSVVEYPLTVASAGMHLIGVYLIGARYCVYVTGMWYVMGMHLIGMHLIGVNNMGGGEITV
jgi:hypothetical protein